MQEHPFDRIRKDYGVGINEVVRYFNRAKSAWNIWQRIKKRFDEGTLTLGTLRNVADAIGLPTWLFLYIADTYAGNRDDDDIDVFEAIKRIAENDKELAFSMYRELLEMGVKISDEMRKWVDENL